MRPDTTIAPAPNLPPNTSGQGNKAVVPPGVRGWSWGAFLMHGVWAISNRCWIGLFAFVPVIGIPVALLLGCKGRTWAWRRRRWESVAQFNEVQRRWAIAGTLLYALVALSLGIREVVGAS